MVSLSIGKSTYDITVPLDDFPVENSKMYLKEKLEGGGGSASNVSYLLGKWNVDSYFAGIVGYDDIGTNIKKELESAHVHTNFLEVNYERKTTTTFILANKKNSSRTQITVEPEVYHLKKTDFDIIPDVIYSDGFEYSATQAAFNKYQNAITILGAGVNYADEKEIIALAKYAKYIIFSVEFACHFTKMKVDLQNGAHLLNLYKELKEKLPNKEIIVTLHNMGVLYSTNNEIKVMPTIQVQELDRTGAGDVFDGAFAYSIGRGYDMEKCMRIANIAAGLSTTKYGAKNSIPLLSDVIGEYEKRFGPLEGASASFANNLNEQVTNETQSVPEVSTNPLPEEQSQTV